MEPSEDKQGFAIVGLGASAGGLEAMEGLFAAMPPHSGMAFVVVTHQHVGHLSLLPELLGRRTAIPVVALSPSAPTKVEPDHVYIAPPGRLLSMVDGVLHPVEAGEGAPHQHLPIDYFFRSLARDQRERAIAIILSGTGFDGTLGLKEIKACLGMVMVQQEASARYASMPHSAIATDIVDFVLPVSEMPAQLQSYAQSAFLIHRERAGSEDAPVPPGYEKVLALLRDRTGHDFSLYKAGTVRRRIERRMTVHRLDTIEGYAQFLARSPVEPDALFRELLIGVTSFFRDPEAFDALGTALGKRLSSRPDDDIVRAWVPGCSTGEEAYAIAILLREAMDRLGRSFAVQIFATDIDSHAVDVARSGVYPAGIAADVVKERLDRFFARDGDTYRVKKEIREMVVFAPQNVVDDPPFTKLDLLSCRNLLIYLDTRLQRRLLPAFHYSLRAGGILFLGSSETISSFGDLFDTVDKKWKIYERREGATGTYVAGFPALLPTDVRPANAVGRTMPPMRSLETGVAQRADKLFLRELAPASLLVHERGDVVHIHGRTGLFLEPAPGPQTTTNVFNMAREGLQLELAAAMRQAASQDTWVVRPGVRVRTNGDFACVDLRVKRISEPEAFRGLFLISFEDARPEPHPEVTPGPSEGKDLLDEAERELLHARGRLQDTVEELETANDDLKSSNEELQSANEELQSTNEELETSKEEMQSLNEELNTVNSELQEKLQELSHANDDMKNLLNSTEIATVFLDGDLNIVRYTEQAKRVIRLIPSDVGRPIGDLLPRLRYGRLLEDAREVLRTLVVKEVEVAGEGKDVYLMRILPYRTAENVIDGLVIIFVDVTNLRRLELAEERLLDALRNSPTSVFGQDRQLRVLWTWSAGFGRQPAEVIGRTDEDLFGAEQARPLVAVKRRVMDSGKAERCRVALTVGGQAVTYDMYVEPMRDRQGEVIGVSCVATELPELT